MTTSTPHGHGGHNLTGMIIFLCSESVIFLAFFAGYAVLKLSSPIWLPEGVEGLEVRDPLINTLILVSSQRARKAQSCFRCSRISANQATKLLLTRMSVLIRGSRTSSPSTPSGS
ncbi:MAG: cytochrome c oxidase subunit 3, partial [Cyanobium sp.]